MTYKNQRDENRDREELSERNASLSRYQDPDAGALADDAGSPAPVSSSHEALSDVRRILEEGTEIGRMLRRDPEFVKGREQAIVYLSKRPRSSGKVRDNLTGKGISPETARDVTDSLIQDGYIDDLKIARQLLAERQGRKAESYFAAEQRLLQAGIPRAIAKKAVNEARETKSEASLLAGYLKAHFHKELLQLKNQELGWEEAKETEIRIYRAAERRGFQAKEASRILARWGITTFL